MKHIAAGVQFRPAHVVAGGPQFIDRTTGLPYSMKEVKGILAKGEDHLAKAQLEVVKGTIANRGKGAERQEKLDARRVQLPGGYGDGGKEVAGDVVMAPSAQEAQALRKIVHDANKARSKVRRALEIRKQTGWWASPSARKELGAIESELTALFAQKEGLGALTGSDRELAQAAGAKVLSVTPGSDAAIKSFEDHTMRALRDRVRTYADAPASAQGRDPSSFTPGGR